MVALPRRHDEFGRSSQIQCTQTHTKPHLMRDMRIAGGDCCFGIDVARSVRSLCTGRDFGLSVGHGPIGNVKNATQNCDSTNGGVY